MIAACTPMLMPLIELWFGAHFLSRRTLRLLSLPFRCDYQEIVAVVKLTLRRISTVVLREEAHREKQGKRPEPLINMKKV